MKLQLAKGIVVAAACLAVQSNGANIRGGSGASGPPALNPNLVVSATGSPGMIVSESKLTEHLQASGNYTAFDHDDLHNHVVAHYKTIKSTPETLEITPDIVGDDDGKDVKAAVGALKEEDKAMKAEDDEINKIAAEKEATDPNRNVKEDLAKLEKGDDENAATGATGAAKDKTTLEELKAAGFQEMI